MTSGFDMGRVAAWRGEPAYSSQAPYHTDEHYFEYPYTAPAVAEPNPAYRGVREALRLLRLDEARFGTHAWNPLGQIVQPGNTVVLKPNFIRDFHDTRPDYVECVITHGSIIRAVLDYVAIALQGRGRVVICDAPQCEASFERIRTITGLDEILAFYRQHSPITVEVIDLRPEYAEKVDGVIIGHKPLPGDPKGYTKINLGKDSEFAAIPHLSHLLYGSEYEASEVAAHHHGETHEYLLSRTVMEADVFINLPKMKTHKKVGVTLNLKNLVGINGNKNWLPHHREGTPAQGGDQFADSGWSERIERAVTATFKRHFPRLGRLRKYIGGPAKAVGKSIFGDTNVDRVRSGNWYGNDTTWRMVLDLNRALFYGDGEGRLHDQPTRRFFSVVDGIVAGEGNGPSGPDARPAGVVLAGFDAVAVDLACTRIMGIDYLKLPSLHNALKAHRYSLANVAYDDVEVASNVAEWSRRLVEFEGSCLAFRPHFGWKGHVEIRNGQLVGAR